MSQYTDAARSFDQLLKFIHEKILSLYTLQAEDAKTHLCL
jgi:hypothetical protein